MKYERGSIRGSTKGVAAMIGNQQSVCLAIAFFAILRATLYATLERENASFSVIHGEDVLFYFNVTDRCKYLKIDTKLCQVISDYPLPL
ncbi:MAG: hypothetical protein V1766_13505 [Pseudomonadota bacterium]